LGITLVVKHFSQPADGDVVEGGDTARGSGLLPILRIESVNVQMRCMSLTYFLQNIAEWKNVDSNSNSGNNHNSNSNNSNNNSNISTNYRQEGVPDKLSTANSASSSSTGANSSTATAAPTQDNFSPSASSMKYDRKTVNRLRAAKRNKDSKSRYTTRFLPLIIDEEHAVRALPLLTEELLRLDRLNEEFYECPVRKDQPPVVTRDQLKIQRLTSAGAGLG
jgi:hypothetical protein